MIEPLKQWYCDVCSEIIEKPNNGYVIWKQGDDHLGYGFKIIHQSKCDDKSYRSSEALRTFLGEDGRNYLLSFLSIGQIKINLGQVSSSRVKDMDEFVDFFRRVQTPYYEEARRRFNESELLDYFSDSNEFNPYTEEALKEIIEL